jgi:hypothetical protein
MNEPSVSPQDIYYRLGQLEGKIDAFLTRLSTHENEVSGLEARIQELEKTKHMMIGYAAAISAITALIIKFVTLNM